MTLVMLGASDDMPRILRRQPAGEARREDVLRDMLFANPEMLPLDEIDPGIGRVVAVARELSLPGVGRIDALLVGEHGRLVVVECKLWRNPQARREVVGQILDYARTLARFSYEDLQREISSASGRSGNALYACIREAGGTIDEARLVDQVSRDLAQGRFLLLIVGDGITEGAQRIGEYLRDQPGLAFGFAMIEMAQYGFSDPVTGAERIIVQPRTIVKTVEIERMVVRIEGGGIAVEPPNEAVAAPVSPRRAGGATIDPDLQQGWRDFVERFAAHVTFDDPGQPPPRLGGLGWMKLQLPGPGHLTLWRSKPENVIGAMVQYRGADGLAVYDDLVADQAAIDLEFAEAGLPAPVWERDDDRGWLSMTAPSLYPWDAAAEAAQIDWFGHVANRFVNSLRPRLLARGAA